MEKFKIEYYYECELEDSDLEDILHEVIVYDKSWEEAVEKIKSKNSKDCVIHKVYFEAYDSECGENAFFPVLKRRTRRKKIY